MHDTTSHRGTMITHDTIYIPDPMFQDAPTKFERLEQIKKNKQEKSKIKAEQSFAKAHSKRRKKK